MKLGFVGVGKHAQKMAAAFRECGAEVVAYDRRQPVQDSPAFEDFGDWLPWQEQIKSPGIDALIICAPPAVTTEVALACAKAGKRCVATKPLMLDTPPEAGIVIDMRNVGGTVWRDSHYYVDLWRLYSPAWLAMKDELRGKTIQSVHVDFYGNGPVRGFSGLLDYGPHALAFVADLMGEIPEMTWRQEVDTFRGHKHAAWGSGERVSVTTGNGFIAGGQTMRVTVKADGLRYAWIEDEGNHVYRVDGAPSGAPVMVADRAIALRAFCRAFLAGEPSNTLRISCEAHRVLASIESGRDLELCRSGSP